MNTYDLWKASVQLAEDATSEAERAHHYAVSCLLRGDAVKDYFASIAGQLYDPMEEVGDTPDDNQVMEFFRDLDALRTPPKSELDKVTDRALTKGLDALQAMESLNYTGDHTHFEVLADARQVLAAVMMGKEMPKLERFRCPSLREVKRDIATDSSAGQLQCTQQLPHSGPHCSGSYSWDDEHSINPPKSYDEPSVPAPVQICGTTGMLGGSPPAVVCVRADEHKGMHSDAAGREWIG